MSKEYPLKGFPFKVMAPKDIASVLNMIGVHPAVTAEAVEKPVPEIASSFFQHLSEFAYDMDAQEVKAQLPFVMQHVGQQHWEIFDEAMDVLIAFKLARQLVLINVVDDFSLKDFWEPQTKRFRVMLSAIINFCRYKEGRVSLITRLKEQLQVHESQRLEHVDNVSEKEQELAAAQERNSQELRPMRDAEREVQRAQAEIEKLKGHTKCADRVAQEIEDQMSAARAQLKEQEDQKAKLQEQVELLQSQVAESPEGIEQDICELQEAVRQERTRLEERSAEKRARIQRDQVLGRLHEGLEGALQELSRLQEAAESAGVAKEMSSAAEEEFQRLQQLLEARCADEADLEQRVKHVALEHERAKEAHEERIKDLEARRQTALVQHKLLQTKRAEEQRHQHQLQTQRLELEAEVANARRAQETEVIELHERQQSTHDQAQAYMREVDSMLLRHHSDGGSGARHPSGSPERSFLRPRQGSPSPARAAVNPLGFMSGEK